METEQLHELLLQSLEHERGGVLVYETALQCVVNDDLHEELEKYLEQTEAHVAALEQVFSTLELDSEYQTPGRRVIHDIGRSLVKAMKDARSAGDPAAAELIACECVVYAETKCQLDWDLIRQCANVATGEQAEALKEAIDEVGDQEEEHLFHARGWCRELWMKSLGLNAVLPPPEEQLHVTTAIGVARAEQHRTQLR